MGIRKITILLASSLTVLAGATIAPSLPQITKEFDDVKNVEFWAGLLLTLPALFIAAGSPLVGRIIDRQGRLKVYSAGMVLYALSGSTGLYLDNLWLLLAGRALLGISVAMIMTVSVTLIGDYYAGNERRDLLGKQGVFMSLGGVIYVAAGGFLADIGWRMPFALYFFSIIVLVLALKYLAEPEPQNGDEAGLKENLDSRHYVILLTAVVTMIAFYMVPVHIPFLVEEIGIEKNFISGLAIAGTTLGSIVTAATYGKIRAKISAPGIVSVAFLLIGSGYIFVSLSGRLSELIPSLFLSGLGLGMLLPNLNTWIIEITTGAVRGKAIGLVSSMLFLGQFLSPIATDPVKNQLSIFKLFFCAGIFILMLAFIYFLFRRKLKS